MIMLRFGQILLKVKTLTRNTLKIKLYFLIFKYIFDIFINTLKIL